jgi:hypothetical protein
MLHTYGTEAKRQFPSSMSANPNLQKTKISTQNPFSRLNRPLFRFYLNSLPTNFSTTYFMPLLGFFIIAVNPYIEARQVAVAQEVD